MPPPVSERIESVEQLEERLSRPTPTVLEAFRESPGDVLILGVAGKMGPSLARMARRAAQTAGQPRRVLGVARFSNPEEEARLRAHGIETWRADLLDAAAVERLPDAPNVVFMAGMKFGSTGNEAATWAMNSYLPGLVARRFARSRIVAFSTGNVYGLVPVATGGSREDDAPQPVGEYAMSCLGRERVFEYFSRTHGTRVSLIRLNYACDLRYGVLVDLALKIRRGEPVDLGMSWFNTLWQGDANAMALASLRHTGAPPAVFNVTGPERLRVREVCERLGARLGRAPVFTGQESSTALLSDARRAFEQLGHPTVGADQLLEWVADWVRRDQPLLHKPTHFESRDGRF
jgi:nucleoside-diphosphate-sugar epimerase